MFDNDKKKNVCLLTIELNFSKTQAFENPQNTFLEFEAQSGI